MRFTAILLIAMIACTFARVNSPANAVVDKVDSLMHAAAAEQTAQTKLHASQVIRCKNERAFRNKEVSDAEVAMGASKEQLEICQTEQPIAGAGLRMAKAQLVTTNAQISTTEAEKKIFDLVNEARKEEHAEMLSAIQGAYEIIGKFANGKNALSSAVFVEVSQKVNSAFRLAVKHNLHSHMIPVLSGLVQLTATPATRVSTKSLERVVSLLRKLEAEIKKSEAGRNAEYVRYHTQYVSQTGLLAEQVRALSAIIKTYKSYILALAKCVATEGHILAEATAKYNRNGSILAATINMCTAYNAKYAQQTKQRIDYQATLAKLREFIVHAISSFKSGLYSHNDYTHQ